MPKGLKNSKELSLYWSDMYLGITEVDHDDHMVSMCSYSVDCENAPVMGKYFRSISVHHSKQSYLLMGKKIICGICEPILRNILLLDKVKWKNSINLILAKSSLWNLMICLEIHFLKSYLPVVLLRGQLQRYCSFFFNWFTDLDPFLNHDVLEISLLIA